MWKSGSCPQDMTSQRDWCPNHHLGYWETREKTAISKQQHRGVFSDCISQIESLKSGHHRFFSEGWQEGNQLVTPNLCRHEGQSLHIYQYCKWQDHWHLFLPSHKLLVVVTVLLTVEILTWIYFCTRSIISIRLW